MKYIKTTWIDQTLNFEGVVKQEMDEDTLACIQNQLKSYFSSYDSTMNKFDKENGFLVCTYTDSTELCFSDCEHDSSEILVYGQKVGEVIVYRAVCFNSLCAFLDSQVYVPLYMSPDCHANVSFHFVRENIGNGYEGVGLIVKRMYGDFVKLDGKTYYVYDPIECIYKVKADFAAYLGKCLLPVLKAFLNAYTAVGSQVPTCRDAELIKECKEYCKNIKMHKNMPKLLKCSNLRDDGFVSRGHVKPNQIATSGKMICLKTAECSNIHPGNNLTECLPEYNVNADSKPFEKFVAKITRKDESEDLFNMIKWMFGSAMHGDCAAKKFFVLHGPTNCGKSTLMSIVCKVLGHFAKGAMSADLFKNNNAAKEYIAELEYKRIANIIDTSEGVKMDGGAIKRLVSGDGGEVTGKKHYKGLKEFKSTATIFIETNDIIALPLKGPVYDRLVVIPFVRQFVLKPDESNPLEFKRDIRLVEKHTGTVEASQGVFKFLVECAVYYWTHQEFKPTEEMEELRYRFQLEKSTSK